MGVGYRNEVGGFLCGWSLRKPPKCWGPGEEGEEVNSAPGTRPDGGGRQEARRCQLTPRAAGAGQRGCSRAPEPPTPDVGEGRRPLGTGAGAAGRVGAGRGEASGSPGLPVRAAAGGCGRGRPGGAEGPPL